MFQNSTYSLMENVMVPEETMNDQVTSLSSDFGPMLALMPHGNEASAWQNEGLPFLFFGDDDADEEDMDDEDDSFDDMDDDFDDDDDFDEEDDFDDEDEDYEDEDEDYDYEEDVDYDDFDE